MAHLYPEQRIGSYGLVIGFSHKFLNMKFGVDLGLKYHKDIAYRVQTNMELDRQVYKEYGSIGLGFENPFPRVTVEPYGHNFFNAMYGAECIYKPDDEVWANDLNYSEDEVYTLKPWNIDKFEKMLPVREVLAQTKYLQEHYDLQKIRKTEKFLPHFRIMSSIPNPGSVITAGMAVRGNELLMDYMLNPQLVYKLFDNILQLTFLCYEFFHDFDNIPLNNLLIGNCPVSMLSPDNYMDFNYKYDLQIANYAREIKAALTLHQDSDVSPHLENYAKLGHVQVLDFGQDTDWKKAAQLFPGVDATCLLFPSWIYEHSLEDIEEELMRIMRIGRSFNSFSFAILDVDHFIGEKRIFEFYEIFVRCSEKHKIVQWNQRK
ncbi:MAG: hypothetical protein ABIK53_09335 [bacterium]